MADIRCQNCHVLKEGTAFLQKRKACDLCLQKKQEYWLRVKEREQPKRAEYYRKNRKKILAQTKTRSALPEIRVRIAKTSRLYRKRNPMKAKARSAVNHALRDGRIEKFSCVKCGSKNSQAHHPDYAKPLDVIWLCTPCHWEEHVQVHV